MTVVPQMVVIPTKKVSTRDKFLKDDILDRFHPLDKKVCDIVATHPGEKIDPFYLFRPKPKQCIDYTISQTEAKMDCGPTKVHFQQIRAEYVPFPKGHVFREDDSGKKRHRPQHGRGPVWLYLDEIFKRKVERLQVRYKKEMEERQKRKAIVARLEKRRKRKQRREEEEKRKKKRRNPPQYEL